MEDKPFQDVLVLLVSKFVTSGLSSARSQAALFLFLFSFDLPVSIFFRVSCVTTSNLLATQARRNFFLSKIFIHPQKVSSTILKLSLKKITEHQKFRMQIV